MSAPRPATAWLNYPGDVRPVDQSRPLGPTYEGAYLLWPVDAEYDAESDRTRVGFSLLPPAERVAS